MKIQKNKHRRWQKYKKSYQNEMNKTLVSVNFRVWNSFTENSSVVAAAMAQQIKSCNVLFRTPRGNKNVKRSPTMAIYRQKLGLALQCSTYYKAS